MTSSILTNNGAMAALMTLRNVNDRLVTTQDRISTGLMVADASDNGSVYATGQLMRSDIGSYDVVARTLAVGEANVTLASRAAENIANEINTIRQKLTEAFTVEAEGQKIQEDVNHRLAQIQTYVNAASFKGINMIDGSREKISFLASVDRAGNTLSANYIDVTGTNMSLTGNGSLNSLAGFRVTGRTSVAGEVDTVAVVIPANINVGGVDTTRANLEFAGITGVNFLAEGQATGKLVVYSAGVRQEIAINRADTSGDIATRAAAVLGSVVAPTDGAPALVGGAPVTAITGVTNVQVGYKKEGHATLAAGFAPAVAIVGDAAQANHGAIAAGYVLAANALVQTAAKGAIATLRQAAQDNLGAFLSADEINNVVDRHVGRYGAGLGQVASAPGTTWLTQPAAGADAETQLEAVVTNMFDEVNAGDYGVFIDWDASTGINSGFGDTQKRAVLNYDQFSTMTGQTATSVVTDKGVNAQSGFSVNLTVSGTAYSIRVDANGQRSNSIALSASNKEIEVRSIAELQTALQSSDALGSGALVDGPNAANGWRLNIRHTTADRPVGSITDVSVTTHTGQDSLNAKLAIVDTALQFANGVATTFGSVKGRIKQQVTFVKQMSSLLTTGLGVMVDSDLPTESARLRALQSQQQLATQALSIANQAPQALLTLFRN